MTKYDVAIFLLAAAIIGLIIYNVQRYQTKKSVQKAMVKPVVVEAAPVVIETPVVIEEVIETPIVVNEEAVEEIVPVKKAKKALWSDEESPESAFPSMHADLGDKDFELAQAYTYENLQDSMLNRETSVRGSGNTHTSQFEQIKNEIKLSGQTLEQFRENSWAPIPEKLSQIWNETAEVKLEKKVVRPTRAALAEAASLSVDSTQNINLKSSQDTMKSLQDILSAKKRGKALGLTLPGLTAEQISAFAKLESEKSFSGLIRTIKSF